MAIARSPMILILRLQFLAQFWMIKTSVTEQITCQPEAFSLGTDDPGHYNRTYIHAGDCESRKPALSELAHVAQVKENRRNRSGGRPV